MNFQKDKFYKKLTTGVFYLSILLFIIAFNFSDHGTGGWTQQFMPSLNGRFITDITFLDSLTGYAITNNLSPGDTGYILKTTNGGDNWNFSFTVDREFTAIDFVNFNTGYACGGSSGGTTYLCKTTNAGMNWFTVNCPSAAMWRDMSVLSNDTLWLVDSDGLTGGVFRTTNGGLNWIRQFGGFTNQNPDKIYMFNSRIGFIVRNNSGAPILRKTTDGGFNWFPVLNEGFTDMHFADSLTGWKCWGETDSIKHTTNGGINWVKQFLPPEVTPLFYSRMLKFTFVNRDTAWGVGGAYTYTGFNIKGIIYKTTNGGKNWGYQLPDTINVNSGRYRFIDFVNRLNGWAYTASPTGVHTVTGGDTTFFVGIKQVPNYIPEKFTLDQNYPNPFNPITSIPFELKESSHVSLRVYDIRGRMIEEIVNGNWSASKYVGEFNGTDINSGIYFYRIEITGDNSNEMFTETKRMILLK